MLTDILTWSTWKTPLLEYLFWFRKGCTVVERVEKSQNDFLTFSHIIADLGMGKHMVKIFLMNSMKIIGFGLFKVELFCWTIQIYYINQWFLELYSETAHHCKSMRHITFWSSIHMQKYIKKLLCGNLRNRRKMHFIFSDPNLHFNESYCNFWLKGPI